MGPSRALHRLQPRHSGGRRRRRQLHGLATRPACDRKARAVSAPVSCRCCSCSKGELLGLRRCDVDLDTREVTVVQQRQLDCHGGHLVGPRKSDAGRRTVTVPAAVIDDLRQHLTTYAQPDPEGYVFTGHKGARRRESERSAVTPSRHLSGHPHGSVTISSGLRHARHSQKTQNRPRRCVRCAGFQRGGSYRGVPSVD